MSEKNEWKLVPVDRTYDMRVKAIRAFNTAEQAGKDRDDALDAAFQAMLAAAPCPTCNDQGAVGNILTAEPCPDCSPAPSAPGDAQDERQALEAWAKKKKMPLARIGQQYDDFWVDHAWNGWQARASVAAPAAGDALDRAEMFRHQLAYERAKNERLLAILVGIHGLTLPAPIQVGGTTYVFTPPEAVEILRGLSDRIRAIPDEIAAALAAQVPQQGEA